MLRVIDKVQRIQHLSVTTNQNGKLIQATSLENKLKYKIDTVWEINKSIKHMLK